MGEPTSCTPHWEPEPLVGDRACKHTPPQGQAGSAGQWSSHPKNESGEDHGNCCSGLDGRHHGKCARKAQESGTLC